MAMRLWWNSSPSRRPTPAPCTSPGQTTRELAGRARRLVQRGVRTGQLDRSRARRGQPWCAGSPSPRRRHGCRRSGRRRARRRAPAGGPHGPRPSPAPPLRRASCTASRPAHRDELRHLLAQPDVGEHRVSAPPPDAGEDAVDGRDVVGQPLPCRPVPVDERGPVVAPRAPHHGAWRRRRCRRRPRRRGRPPGTPTSPTGRRPWACRRGACCAPRSTGVPGRGSCRGTIPARSPHATPSAGLRRMW